MFSLLVEALPSGRIIASGIPLTPPTIKLETGKAWACEIEIPAAAQAQGIHASSLPEWGCALWIDNGSRIVGEESCSKPLPSPVMVILNVFAEVFLLILSGKPGISLVLMGSRFR